MPVRVGIISLGCAKNLVDSEVMLGLLNEKGYEIVNREDSADILIVNTCAFIDAAKQESMDTIAELVSLDGDRKIIVAGCLAQRYRDRLKERLGDKIHAVLGTGDFHNITEVCERVLAEDAFLSWVTASPNYIYDHTTPRLRTTPPHLAYVKIAEGCDNRCSYCIVPQLRGRYRSRTMESIVAEVTSLARSGVKEIDLIAQDTTYYGRDLKNGTDLPSLLKKLILIPEVQWIRVLYWHPAHVTDELIELVAHEEKLCSYIDIPVQHIHDEVLEKMGRRTTKAQIYDLIAKIRDVIPEATLRTSLIVGFPGETEEHFSALVDFVNQVQFDHLGVFTYSAEEGTKAVDMEGRVPDSVKTERIEKIAQLHKRISAKKRRRLIGQRRIALVDRVDSGDTAAIGRTQGQAPEIDDVVYIVDGNVKSGEFVELEIIDTYQTFDLVGRVVR